MFSDMEVRLVIAENDEAVVAELKPQLERLGYLVAAQAVTGEDAIDLVRKTQPAIVLMSISLRGEIGGLEAAARIETEFQIPVVLLASANDSELLERALRDKPFSCLVKPVAPLQLRIELERALHPSQGASVLPESRLSAILNSLGGGMIVVDRDERVIFINQEARKLLDLPTGEGTGQPLGEVFRLIHGDGKEDGLTQAFLLRNTKERLPIEWKRVELAGRPDEAVIVFHDVSDRRQIEKRLSFQRDIMEAVDNAIVVTDPKGDICWVNKAFCRLTGYKRNEIIGKNTRIFKSGRHGAALYQDLWQTILAGKVWRSELINKHKDGGFYYEGITITPFRDANGKISCFICIKEDISERKKTEESLQRSEEYYRTLIENGTDTIFVVNPDGIITYVTPSCRKVFGCSPAELQGQALINVIQENERERVQDGLQEALKVPGEARLSMMHVTRFDGGPPRILEGFFRGVMDAEGRPRIIISARDITKREKNAQEVVTLARISAESPSPILRISAEGVIDYGNKASLPLLREIGVELWQTLPEKFRQIVRDVLASGDNYESRMRFGEHNYSMLFVPVAFEGYVNLYATDITEQVHALSALQKSERQYRAIIEDQTDLICRMTPAYKFSFVNDAFCRFFNLSHAETAGMHFPEVLGEQVGGFFEAKMSNIGVDDSVFVIEQEIEGGENEASRWLEWTCRVLFDLSGDVIEVQVVGREITDRKLLGVMAREKEAAEISNRMKTEFMSNMSHEIRTPMNGIMGMSELLLDTPMTDEQRDYAQTIHRSSEALLAIINDLLDFSRIEEGRMKIEEAEFDLGQAVEDIASLLAPRANEKGLELLVDFSRFAPRLVIGDQNRIRQIILNLANNAIKFTHEGYVLIHVDHVLQSDGVNRFTLAVEDSGIGISLDKLDVIFERFSQADASTTRFYGGTGLGLTISRQLAQLMHGNITANSCPGVGSTFWFTIPLTLSESPQPSFPDLTTQAASLSCYLVDAYDVTMRAHGGMLTDLGLPHIVCFGREICDLLKRDDPSRLRVVIIDERVEDVDCFVLARKIRELFPDDQLKLVLLASPKTNLEDLHGKGVRFDGVIYKPLRPRLFAEQLHALISGKKDPVSLPESSDSQSTSLATSQEQSGEAVFNASILLVEDNLVNQRVAQRMLEKLGCQVTLAGNGRQALETLSTGRFDLVLMDCQMPVMDGYSATRELRNPDSPWYSPNLPVLALTAHIGEAERERTREAGMNDHITKPLKSSVLREKLAAWLGNPCQSEEKTSVKTAEQEEETVAPVFDREGAYERLGDDDGLLRELIHVFFADLDKQLESLRASLAAKDAPAAENTSHALKGGSSNIGAERARQRFFEMEKAGREGRLDDLASLLETIPALIAEFKSELAAQGYTTEPS